MSSESPAAREGEAGEPEPASGLERLFGFISMATTVLAALICAVLIVVTTFSVVVYQRGITISWLDDLLRMLLIWLVFIGSVGPVWRRDHITMDAFYMRFRPPARRTVDIIVAILGVGVCGLLTWVSISSAYREYEFNTLLSSGEIPQWPQTLAIPLSFGLMTISYAGVLVTAIVRRQRDEVTRPIG